MKKKQILTITAILLTGVIAAAGCGKKEEEPVSVLEPIPVEEQAQSGEAAQTASQEVPASDNMQEQMSQNLFAALAGREFYFSSGAGGWRTVLNINEEGLFNGNYMDSDMGDSGENYPNGTVYECDFNGSFTEPVYVEDGIYKTTIKEIYYVQQPDTTEIKDDIRHCYTSAYGLDRATDLYIYEQGIDLKRLPEDYINWVRMGLNDDTKLPFYGIYNPSGEAGFSSYPNADAGAQTASAVSSEEILAAIAATEEQAAQLQHELETQDMSQMDYNFKSQDLYELWDNQLNQLWSYLQSTLSTDEMDRLTAEERAWIDSKEAAVKEAGAPYEGGSIQPMIMNQKAAELTKARVLELKEKYIK